MNERMGEAPWYGRVTSATVSGFTAECWSEDTEGARVPRFGELVCAVDGPAPVYALVTDVATGPADSTRPVQLRGAPGVPLEEVHRQHPHVLPLLRTGFSATTVGHGRDGTLRPSLPGSPPPVLAGVRGCTDDELAQVCRSPDFVPLLMLTGVLGDQALAALVRRAAATHPDPSGELVRLCREIGAHYAGDPQRWMTLLRLVDPGGEA